MRNGGGENERGGHEATPAPSLAILEPGGVETILMVWCCSQLLKY
jgi:hypothetical protein